MKHYRSLIPYPQKLQAKGENFFYFSKTAIDVKNSELKELIEKEVSQTPLANLQAQVTSIDLVNDNSLVSDEAYILKITQNQIIFHIKSEKGLFYGLQTLKQLIRFNHNKLYPLEIQDYPAFEWRGLHLDVARHFFSITEIYSLLDRMAELKLNRFHWHLSDDQGWRIESKLYPKLHEQASARLNSNASVYQAYYLQAEIKDVIAYAQSKMIMVIPEIDLPGHTQAIISAYPDLSCHKKHIPVWNQWGVSENILCVSDVKTLAFLDSLLSEIIPLFPAPYFHIGGDECPTRQWENCPKCQAKLKEINAKSFRSLQGDFNQHLASILQKHDKIMIGWDEIADAKAPAGSILMCWRGDGKEAVRKANEQDLKYILTPNHPLYFDWKQSAQPQEEGAFGISSLADVYNYDYASLKSAKMLGMQGNIWTERIDSLAKLQYMAFPRTIALAENCWTSKENKDYNRFLLYLKRFLAYYVELKQNYASYEIDKTSKFEKKQIICRDNLVSDLPELNDVSSIFNPGAIKLDDNYYLLLRVQNRGRESYLVKAQSDDGIDFTLDDQPVNLIGMDDIKENIKHIYDPRLTFLNNLVYIVTAIDTNEGCYLGLFTSRDLENLQWHGFISEHDNRNGVIFPEKIKGRYARLERPNKSILANGTKTGSAIYISYSDDLLTWDSHEILMQGNPHYWDELIGSGPVPLKTRHGWLHIYHGVATHFASSNIYQAGFSFLDIANPAKVIFRSKYNFLEPREYYECSGQVPNVVFPTGIIALEYDEEGYVKDDSDLYLYYGCADTSVGLLKTNMSYFIEKMLIEKGV